MSLNNSTPMFVEILKIRRKKFMGVLQVCAVLSTLALITMAASMLLIMFVAP